MKKVKEPDKKRNEDDLNQYLQNQKQRIESLKKVLKKLKSKPTRK